MSPAFAPNRRRQLALGALTVLLHVLLFHWLGGQVGPTRDEAPRAEAPIEARLIDEARPVPVAAMVPPPQPRQALPPLPDLDPEPVTVADAAPPKAAEPAPDAGAPPGDGAAQAAGQGNGAGDGQAGAAPAVAQTQPQTQPQAQAAPQPPAQAVPEARHYKVDLPPSGDITLDVARVDADGTRWSGEEALSWQVTPSSYRIRVEAGISVVFARVNLLTVTSEGTVGDAGFVPTLMTEKRRGRAMTATHFNRDQGTLTFSASQASYPLVAGAQDKASVPLQLTAIARGDARQLAGNIDIFVGEDRDASVFSFTVAGQEQIETPLGRIATVHLVRPPKPGSYSSRLELWLAPERGWIPVQIRNVEANGAVTTQTASKIVMKD